MWGIKASLSTTEDIVPLPLSFAYRTKMSSTAGVLLKDTGNNRKQRERWEIKNCHKGEQRKEEKVTKKKKPVPPEIMIYQRPDLPNGKE